MLLILLLWQFCFTFIKMDSQDLTAPPPVDNPQEGIKIPQLKIVGEILW
jgi:hypothetical protein